MTTNSWMGAGAPGNVFGTKGISDANWSLGHVPTSSEDATGSFAFIITTKKDVGGVTLSTTGGLSGVLDIDASAIFTTTAGDGGGLNVVDGAININSVEFRIGGGDLQGSGPLELTSTGLSVIAALVVSADGTGLIKMDSASPQRCQHQPRHPADHGACRKRQLTNNLNALTDGTSRRLSDELNKIARKSFVQQGKRSSWHRIIGL